jgi:hypothetical protein
MSARRRGKQFEVRWTEGGRKLSRSFLRAVDARAFDLDIKRRKQLGALAPGIIQSRQTLAEFMEEEWWPRYAIPNLASDTRWRYLEVWGVHLLPRLGDYELREITPMVVEDPRAQMKHAKVGAPTQRKALMLLQGILTYVAEQAGHSIATLARHYAGTMRELETKPRVPAAEAIQQARDEVCGTH